MTPCFVHMRFFIYIDGNSTIQHCSYTDFDCNISNLTLNLAYVGDWCHA